MQTHLFNIPFFTTQTALSIFDDFLPYQPATGQPVLHRLSLFSSHLSNWKLESAHFLLRRHFYGTLFQMRCASALLMVYLDVLLLLVTLSTSVSKLISSPSHIHLSNLLLFHRCTLNSTRNDHGLWCMINDFTPLPTNPVMPGRWRSSWASAHTYVSAR